MPRAAICIDLEAIKYCAKVVEQARCEFSMSIDGVVLKYNETCPWDKERTTALAPCAAIAYKFTMRARATYMVNVCMRISRKGVLAPVAVLRSVMICDFPFS